MQLVFHEQADLGGEEIRKPSRPLENGAHCLPILSSNDMLNARLGYFAVLPCSTAL